MNKKTIAVIGSGFAGYSTALHLASQLGKEHEILVIDKKSLFLFLPSLVWHPFGYRNADDISFDVRPIYRDNGITFIVTPVYGFDLDEQMIYTKDQDFRYDYMVITTGTEPNYSTIKGLVPGKTAHSITTFREAEKTRLSWKKFIKDPGPLVIGAAPKASYFFTAYEFLLNALFRLKELDLLEKTPVHFFTAEPYLTHFGMGEMSDDREACERLFKNYSVQTYLNAEIHEVKDGLVILENGEKLESAFTLVVPEFIGSNAILTTRGLSDPQGLLHVDDQFRHTGYRNVFAAGGSVFIPPAQESKVPCRVPHTRNSTELMARAVAQNIASELGKGEPMSVPLEDLYKQCRSDMNHLVYTLFGKPASNGKDLEFIAKNSQDKWANMSIREHIEASFSGDMKKV